MAHNLNETNGKVSFASTQKVWHNLGQIVSEAMTSKQAIELAGLNYFVSKYQPTSKKPIKAFKIRMENSTYFFKGI